MASQAQLLANRANASRSTGPKTRQGKSRSSQNATRHGLSGQRRHDPQFIEAARVLAGTLQDDYLNEPVAMELACRILEHERSEEVHARLFQRVYGHAFSNRRPPGHTGGVLQDALAQIRPKAQHNHGDAPSCDVDKPATAPQAHQPGAQLQLSRRQVGELHRVTAT